jgi:hypothetical protein
MRHKDNIFTIKEQSLQTRSKQYGRGGNKKNLWKSQSYNTITKKTVEINY